LLLLSWPGAGGSTAEVAAAAAAAAADFRLFTGDGGADDDFDFLEIFLDGPEFTESPVSGLLLSLLAPEFCCRLVFEAEKRK